MADRRGFTLIEIIVTLIIIAILSAIALPNYLNYVNQQAALAAQNNLITIYNAQKNFYLTNGNYCFNNSSGCSSGQPYSPTNPCCDTLQDIGYSLNLNINDTYFSYQCTPPANCIASPPNEGSGNNLEVILTSPIVLPGGSNCPGSGGTGTCNPVCNLTNYCPS